MANSNPWTSPSLSSVEEDNADDDFFGTPMQVPGFATAPTLPVPTNLDGVFASPELAIHEKATYKTLKAASSKHHS